MELTDVPAGHWASAAIQVAANCGIVRGFPDGTFRGNEPITRYQAAVIIARLLEAIKNGECGVGTGGGLSAADLTTLQNAIQELSADLAQLGVRVAELEDNAVTQDDLARVEEIATQARDLAEQTVVYVYNPEAVSRFITQNELARLEDITKRVRDLAEALANQSAQTGVAPAIEPQAVIDLIDQVDAASIAADTALAQARELQDKVDEISGRVDDLEGQLGELGATVEGQADSIAALNDLVVLLNQDVLSLQDRVTALEQGLGEATDNLTNAEATFATQDDLESLREFTTLLRRDQTALADRVGELETRLGAAEGRITAVETRVTTLENNAFTISGTIGLNYYRATTWDGAGGGLGPNFDVDRLYFGDLITLSLTGQHVPSSREPFTTGASIDTKNGFDAATNFADFGNVRAADADSAARRAITVDPFNKTPTRTGIRLEGSVKPTVTLTFGFAPRNLVGATTLGVGSRFDLTLSLGLASQTPYGTPSTGSDTVEPARFTLRSLETVYTVGDTPLTIAFGINPGFAFTDYGFSNTTGRGDGLVVALDGKETLPFGLGLTLVHGSKGGQDEDFTYYTGLMAGIAPFEAADARAYYAFESADLLADDPSSGAVSLYGFAFNVRLAPVQLEGEWNNASVGSDPAQVATFVRGGLELGAFSVSANWRLINSAESYDGLGGAGDYGDNQVGFGFGLVLNAVLGFEAYYDQRRNVNLEGKSTSSGLLVGDGPGLYGATRAEDAVGGTDFGVTLRALALGIEIAPYFYRKNEYTENGTAAYDRTYYGVTLRHDGLKPDALVRGLSFALGYLTEVNGVAPGGSESTLYAYAEVRFAALGAVLVPKGYVSLVRTSSTAFRGDDDVTNYGVGFEARGALGSATRFGVALSVDRSDHSGGRSGAFSSSTTLIAFELGFNPTLLGAPSNFSVAFANRADTNRNGKGPGPSLSFPIGDRAWANGNDPDERVKPDEGDLLGVSVNLSGLYFTFSYFGLTFRYGIFALLDYRLASTEPGGLTFGQAFGIGYTLRF